MELTWDELKTAVEADTHTFARFRGKLHELRMKGQHKEADALQREYDERLKRWINKINEKALKGENE